MNPYKELPSLKFWRLAVADNNCFDIKGLWNPKFDIKENQLVSTYGSCFAQHIGAALKRNGFNWFISENAPSGLSEVNRINYNYGIFSSRTGNIYTTSLLKQWVEWAVGVKQIPEEYWIQNGRFYDPFRPQIEPNGFESLDELRHSQRQTLLSFKESIVKANFFVFTLGLTESWFNIDFGYEYPLCPGTVNGQFDDSKHTFVNQDYGFVLKNLSEAIRLMTKINKKIKFILTVSPVPLTATFSSEHVLVATMHSKSILRSVAGRLASIRENIDYFPSYEIINSPVFRGAFFEPNQRSVNHYGVSFVMNSFFESLHDKFGAKNNLSDTTSARAKTSVVCEEELLDSFSNGELS